MYYKIENRECEVYKKLHQMRTEEIQIGKDNEKAVEEKTGLKFETYLGYSGQQNFIRTPQYIGFKFTEHEKVDLKIWKKDADNPGIFIPNRRTKLGREMDEFLRNGLKGSIYYRPLKILGLPDRTRFVFPYVEIFGEVILIYLDDTYTPNDINVIEITETEFNNIISETTKP